MTEKKELKINVYTLLRIWEWVHLTESFLSDPLIQKTKNYLINESNTQQNLWEILKPTFNTKKNLIYLAIGGKESGKTFTMQGFKEDPGLIPNFTSMNDYSKRTYIQCIGMNNK